MLPMDGSCVSNQRGFKELGKHVDLASYGIVSRPVDLLVPVRTMRSQGKGANFHVWGRPLAPGSFIRLSPNLFVSSPELLVVQLVSSQAKLEEMLDAFADGVRSQKDALGSLGIDEMPVVDAPTEWESIRRLIAATVVACEFAGSYRLDTMRGNVRYHAPRLLETGSLRRMAEDPSARFVAKRVDAVAEFAFDGSASPMETSLALMLTLPLEFGGFCLPKPQLNVSVDIPGEWGDLSDRNQVTPDMLWPGQRVALEYDSAEFHSGGAARQADEDARRSNLLVMLGFRVLRVTPGMVRTLPELGRLARQLARCLGVELAQPSEVELLRRERLFAELMPGHVVRRMDVPYASP